MPSKPKEFIDWDGKSDKKIDSSAFLYLDPRGDKNKFAQCSTCTNFTGSTCAIFDKKFPVKATDTCGLYTHGKPDSSKKGHEVESVTPEEAGFLNQEVRCENCVYGDGKRKMCLLFEKLNSTMPDKFSLDPNIDPKGCCNAFVA